MSARAEALPIPVVVPSAAERLALAALGLAVAVTAVGPIFVRWAWLGSRPTATFLAGLAAMLGGAALFCSGYIAGMALACRGTR